jgi:hypothetical protein
MIGRSGTVRRWRLAFAITLPYAIKMGLALVYDRPESDSVGVILLYIAATVCVAAFLVG